MKKLNHKLATFARSVRKLQAAAAVVVRPDHPEQKLTAIIAICTYLHPLFLTLPGYEAGADPSTT
jgi:hypothetical protein